ncbi:rod shape-determining protein MreC [Varunaivibrio sulfuroxidans]|uniref:Cell shape-determining protein MreC n=1 Tax=Varunaivibrio sulfuroxidans TaxID=1773489 RepID=A0A4R3J592_9PROT|nr:rod shape-determining protein MreC [Varunaivibrio sulfuroxidans]TCS60988.1 rod shape-determining protein MreC [Varunaivibrio sulfuroxidans]WES31606.1 rod shape-determining protein MreC [Varunaivibrio sulfuroxidans]
MKSRPRFGHGISPSARGAQHNVASALLVVVAIALIFMAKADVNVVDRMRVLISDAFSPVLDVVSRPIANVNHWSNQLRELMSVRAENARLREERARLLQWQEVARAVEAENRSLKALLHYVPEGAATYIAARVVADTGGAFANSLLVNAGRRDGVRKGLAVVNGDGLVGRIVDVGRRSSRILLLTDLNSRIPVLISASRTRAILAGDNTSRPTLIHLPPGGTVSPGDRIVTSGSGGAFPPGLPVGLVAAVDEQSIVVQPFVDRYRLEYVRVVDYGLRGVLDVSSSTLAPKSGQKR